MQDEYLVTVSKENTTLQQELIATNQDVEAFERQESEILERYETLEAALVESEKELQEAKYRLAEREKAALEASHKRK
jgi:hypothetical protein